MQLTVRKLFAITAIVAFACGWLTCAWRFQLGLFSLTYPAVVFWALLAVMRCIIQRGRYLAITFAVVHAVAAGLIVALIFKQPTNEGRWAASFLLVSLDMPLVPLYFVMGHNSLVVLPIIGTAFYGAIGWLIGR